MTPLTPRFYSHPDIHQFEKQDYYEALVSLGKKENLKLQALMVLGPLGPLYDYSYLTFLKENNDIRLNYLKTVHDRIRHKATRSFSEKEYQDTIKKILDTKALKPLSGSKTSGVPWPNEDDYQVLFAVFKKGHPEIYIGKILKKDSSLNKLGEKLIDQVNKDINSLKRTYPPPSKNKPVKK